MKVFSNKGIHIQARVFILNNNPGGRGYISRWQLGEKCVKRKRARWQISKKKEGKWKKEEWGKQKRENGK